MSGVIIQTSRIIYVRRNRLYSNITKEVYEKSPKTITLQVYAHFIPDTKEKVINAFDNISNKK